MISILLQLSVETRKAVFKLFGKRRLVFNFGFERNIVSLQKDWKSETRGVR